MKNLHFSILIYLLLAFSASSQVTLGWRKLPQVTEYVRDLYGIHFFNEDSGWICGWQRPDRNYTFLASTYDGGDNWNAMKVGEKTSIYDVYFINDSIGYCLDGDVLKTTNSGDTWDTSFDDFGGDLKGRIKFYNEKYGWAVGGDSTVVRTTDGGSTWEYIIVDSLAKQRIWDLSIVDTVTVLINTSNSVHKTTDGGQIWNIIRFDDFLFTSYYDVEFISLNKGWLVGSNRTILFTDDGGKTWQDQSPSFDADAIHNIDALDSLKAIVVTSNGSILRTNNGGVDWVEQVPPDIFLNLWDVQMVDSLVAYAVGVNGTIVKTTNGGVTWLGNNSLQQPKKYMLYPAFPNPFNPTTKIKFELPQREYVEINVFNTTGQKVHTLFSDYTNAGLYELVFNASDLASGIYICTLKSGSFTQSRKMLLIR